MPGAQASLRLFIALWPSEPVRAQLVRRRDALHCAPPARLTRADKLHLTLHFIGAVPAPRLPEVAKALSLPAPQFELRLDRLAAWNGIVALQPSAVPAALVDLHTRLAACLRRLDLPVETRRYRPHVTLARGVVAPPARAPSPPAVAWFVDGYVLVQSTPAGDYVLLRRYAA